jgi:hypothetical protein
MHCRSNETDSIVFRVLGSNVIELATSAPVTLSRVPVMTQPVLFAVKEIVVSLTLVMGTGSLSPLKPRTAFFWKSTIAPMFICSEELPAPPLSVSVPLHASVSVPVGSAACAFDIDKPPSASSIGAFMGPPLSTIPHPASRRVGVQCRRPSECGPRQRHRVKAQGLALLLGALDGLDQEQEPECTSGAAGGRGLGVDNNPRDEARGSEAGRVPTLM